MDYKERIRSRIQGWEFQRAFRRKVHVLRRLVAGDWTAVDNYIGSQPDPAESLRKGGGYGAEFSDLLITDIPEGRTNRLLKALRILVRRSAYQSPEVDFEDIQDALQESLHEAYLTKVVRDCNGKHHMMMALWDALIGGIGWMFVGMKDGAPAMMWSNLLDTCWDYSAPSASEARWVTRAVRGPLWWLDMQYPKALVFPDDAVDDIGEVVEYYDMEGPGGHFCVYAAHGADTASGDGFILSEENPFGFIPAVPLYFDELPSVPIPTSFVEAMLPAYKAASESEKTIRETIKRMMAFYLMRDGAMQDDEYQKFVDGDIASIIKVDSPENALLPVQHGDVSNTIIQWFQQNDQEIFEMAGTNPYASGGKVEGISYAAEVNAIQSNSDLTAAFVAHSFASFWQDILKKLLQVGVLFDDRDITLNVGGMQLQFGLNDPISSYLVPNAVPLIREGSMTFKTREQQVQEAVFDLDLAMKLAAMFPNAPRKAFERYLRLKNEKDIDGWMSGGQELLMQTGQMQ